MEGDGGEGEGGCDSSEEQFVEGWREKVGQEGGDLAAESDDQTSAKKKKNKKKKKKR